VSVSTIHAANHTKSRIERKKNIVAEQETKRVKDLRFAYRLWSFTIDPHNLVFIDETGIHLGLTRLYGRAPKANAYMTPDLTIEAQISLDWWHEY